MTNKEKLNAIREFTKKHGEKFAQVYFHSDLCYGCELWVDTDNEKLSAHAYLNVEDQNLDNETEFEATEDNIDEFIQFIRDRFYLVYELEKLFNEIHNES